MIIINLEQREEIIKYAKESSPFEACGILAGKNGRVEKVYKMRNTSDTPENCYFMDPKEQLQVMKKMRQEGLEMLGVFHSHPDSEAYPSARDVELAFYPEAVYVIVSLHPRGKIQLRAFRIVEGKIEEEEIKS